VERLWTPWRQAYIEGNSAERSGQCFLCVAPTGDDDRARFILLRAKHVFALLNLYPYNSGHLMIAPYEHTGDFAHLDADTASELTAITQRSVDALQKAYQPDAFNIGMNLGKAAGAGVPDHLHVHVVPRWVADTNFMPIVAETKVLPESLGQTYERLAPYFKS
jgi:ATP adenylyltransferase